MLNENQLKQVTLLYNAEWSAAAISRKLFLPEAAIAKALAEIIEITAETEEDKLRAAAASLVKKLVNVNGCYLLPQKATHRSLAHNHKNVRYNARKLMFAASRGIEYGSVNSVIKTTCKKHNCLRPEHLRLCNLNDRLPLVAEYTALEHYLLRSLENDN